jgi:hypothetical protein
VLFRSSLDGGPVHLFPSEEYACVIVLTAEASFPLRLRIEWLDNKGITQRRRVHDRVQALTPHA